MGQQQQSARTKIDELIAGLADWRGERLAEIRQAIHAELPDVTETWKWMGSQVLPSRAGLVPEP